jgi:hypothetical protein
MVFLITLKLLQTQAHNDPHAQLEFLQELQEPVELQTSALL